MKPLTLEPKKKDSLNPFQLIQEMKEKSSPSLSVSSRHSSSKTVSDQKALDYIFVKPSKKAKSEREGKINDFLTSTGVFQINLNITLSDFDVRVN